MKESGLQAGGATEAKRLFPLLTPCPPLPSPPCPPCLSSLPPPPPRIEKFLQAVDAMQPMRRRAMRAALVAFWSGVGYAWYSYIYLLPKVRRDAAAAAAAAACRPAESPCGRTSLRPRAGGGLGLGRSTAAAAAHDARVCSNGAAHPRGPC